MGSMHLVFIHLRHRTKWRCRSQKYIYRVRVRVFNGIRVRVRVFNGIRVRVSVENATYNYFITLGL